MEGVVNSIHSPTASDMIFTQMPPLAAESAPDVIVWPLPDGERLSASNRIVDWPSPTVCISRSSPTNKTDRDRRMRSGIEPSLRLDDIEALLITRGEWNRGRE